MQPSASQREPSAADLIAFRRNCERGARTGTPESLYSLGIVYEYGIGGASIPLKACHLYTKAAELGLVEAQVHLGEMHALGKKIPHDLAQAELWLTKATEAGSIEGAFCLAAVLEERADTEEDLRRPAALFMQCVAQGHAQAMLHLGFMKMDGRGMLANQPEARTLFQRALDQGVEDAREPLVELLLETESQSDYTQARLLLLQCPARSPEATYNLANLLYNGDGGPANKAVAAKLFRQAANHGDRQAALSRAQMLQFGDGIPADWGRAWQMYERLAKNTKDWIGVVAKTKLEDMMARSLSSVRPEIMTIREPVNDVVPIARPSPPAQPRLI